MNKKKPLKIKAVNYTVTVLHYKEIDSWSVVSTKILAANSFAQIQFIINKRNEPLYKEHVNH